MKNKLITTLSFVLILIIFIIKNLNGQFIWHFYNYPCKEPLKVSSIYFHNNNLNKKTVKKIEILDFSVYKNIKDITLYSFSFQKIPFSIFMLNNLEKLSISNCLIDSIPLELNKLINCKELILNENRISFINNYAFKGLNKLKTLMLDRNNISTLPIDSLLSLEILCLSDNNRLNYLDLFQRLRCNNINELYLSSCNITFIPKDILYFKNLKVFDISNNNIQILPEELKELETLKFLDISYNNFFSFPEIISDIKNLEVLNLSGNKISGKFNGLEKCKTLKILRLNDIGLREIPIEVFQIDSLNELDISFNEINSIPIEIVNLKRLKKIYIVRLKISEFEIENLKILLPKNCKIIRKYSLPKTP